ncbi:hypothetical protein B0H11DRAFT_78595 [Mycena galericulata]|nr:hypothetical protein B0H11DRAFT_78595 [Mycena galericulata]
MSEIAQELIDTILDFLHDDRNSLLSSSLVARKWVPATRFHAFNRIVINNFFVGRQGFRDNAHIFLALCGSPHCSILSSIRTVILNVDTEFTPAGPDAGLLVDLIDALARTPLYKLIFIDHTSLISVPVSLAWIAPRFPDLQELSYNALQRPAADLCALVAGFPALRVLSVYSSNKGSPTAPLTSTLPQTPPLAFAHLHTLRIRLYSRQSEDLLAWLQTAGPDGLRLETLDINVFHAYHNGWGPVIALNALLRATAAHLRALTIHVTYEDSADVDAAVRVERPAEGNLDLSPLRNLHTLHLTAHNVVTVCGALNSFSSDISAAPPPLTTLRVHFLPWRFYAFAPCPCNTTLQQHVRAFADVTQSPPFARLRHFDLGVPEFFGEAGKTAVREFFGLKDGRDEGVLRIGFSEADAGRGQRDSWEGVRGEVFGFS